jgi:short subunit fatty acids transporter
MTHCAQIQQHIHQHHHHYLTYMHSPTISPPFNIYALININYIITIHQLIQFLTIPSKGENTPYYDKPHIQHPSIIHTSSYNHITLSTKDLQGIRS